MAQVDRITFKATTQLIYPDNNTGEISPADIRAQMDDIADSTPFKTTTKTAAPTALDSGYEIGDIWVDFNADFVYLCINNTPGEAIWQNISVPAISNSEIKAAYEANADTNAFDDAAVAKLAGIETAATADQTGAEILAALDIELGSTNWQSQPPAIIPVTTSRALALTDVGDILEVDTAGGAVDLSIPPNATVAFPIGTLITISLIDITAAGTITGGAGVTLNGVVTGSGEITATAFSGVTLYKKATDSWVVQGAIAAVA